MPNGSAAEIGRPHIINQTHIDTAASINPDGTDVALTNCHSPGYTPCWDLGHFAGNQTSLQMGCPGLSNGPIIMVDWKNYWLLFPYRLNGANRKADVIDENEMRTMYPKTWEYLLDHKPILDYRENYSWKDKPNWHAYIYPKNLFEFTKPKLLVKVISNKSSFPFDRSGRYYFTGGGNGPIYGISLDNTSKVSFEYLMGVLNSTLLDYLVHKKSSRQHSGYYIYGKRFIERLPIKIPENIIEEKIAKKIELVVGDILSLAQDRINFINRWLEHVSQMHTDEITLMKILRSDLNNLQYGNSSLSSDVSPVWFSYVSFYPNKNQDILEKEYNDFRIYGHTKNQSIEVFGSYEAVEEKIYEFKFDNKELL
jgi:hypothetical protein